MNVSLRVVQDSDLPIFFEHQRDPISNQMAAFPSREKEPFMLHWVKIRADKGNMMKTILFEGQVAGNILSFEILGEREVGYWLGREFWGKGIATAAVKEFLPEIKQRPLFAHVAKHNIGSRRVLEKCGFVIQGEDVIHDERLDGPVEEYILILK